MIITRILAAATLAVAAVTCAAAEPVSCESFTERQCNEIKAMVAAQRAAVFAELGIPDPAPAPRQSARNPPADSPPAADPGTAANDLPAASDENKTKVFFGGAGGSVLDRGDGDQQSRFELTGSTENNRATLRVASEMSGTRGRFSTLSFGASAPFDKNKQKYANVATLDGLANAFQLSLNYSLFVADDLRSPVGEDGLYTAEYRALCGDAGIGLDDCDRSALEAKFLAARREDKVRELGALYGDPKAWRRSYSIKANVGHDAFDFYLPTTLATDTTTRKPWSVAAQLGFVPPLSGAAENSRGWYFAGGVEYQRSYLPGKVRTFCPAVEGIEPFECTTGNFGPPVKKDKRLASFEARTKVMGGHGMSLRITRDFHNDETGVDLPVYLVKDSAGALNGGLRLGWTNTDKFSFGVFVGGSFDLLPN